MQYKEHNSVGTRFYDYYTWEDRKMMSYDYAKHGLLQHLISSKIVNSRSKNKILDMILSYYEKSIIFMLKYVDELKNFKNYHAKNR